MARDWMRDRGDMDRDERRTLRGDWDRDRNAGDWDRNRRDMDEHRGFSDRYNTERGYGGSMGGNYDRAWGDRDRSWSDRDRGMFGGDRERNWFDRDRNDRGMFGGDRERNYFDRDRNDRMFGSERNERGWYGGDRNFGERDRGFFDRLYGSTGGGYGDYDRNRDEGRNYAGSYYGGGFERGGGGYYSGGYGANIGGLPGSTGIGYGGYGGYGSERHRMRGEMNRYDTNRDYYARHPDRDERGFFQRVGDWWSDVTGGDERRRGRGPKHYTRSDERIRDDVYDRLMDNAWVDATDVEVKVTNGEVTLTGSVPSRHDKRTIEDIAETVLGVKEVHNQLRRQDKTMQAGTTGTTGTRTTTTGTTTTTGDNGPRRDIRT
jgi:hypothetical protein